jgi:hypothetical protein
MKKPNIRATIAAIFAVALLTLPSTAFAQTATPAGDKANKLEELKDRLATVVAELRQTQRRAISGTIKSTSITTAVIETETKDLKIELIDELSVFQMIKGKRTALTVDDLAAGDFVTVFGEYDTTLELLKAKVIFIQSPLPALLSGKVSKVDAKAFTLTLETKEGPIYTVDIEKATTTQTWTGEEALEKSGFSQITVGDIVHVAGTLVAKQTDRISALRILNLGKLTGEPPTATPKATSSASPKATPSATIKPSATPAQ